VALGLWQLGVFDRAAVGKREATHVATARQLDVAARPSPTVASSGDSAAEIARDGGREATRSTMTVEQLTRDPDPGVREEASALQEALAAEVANDH
jgi:lysine/ornithine N-monooxygenase